jgi:hypothetical protein
VVEALQVRVGDQAKEVPVPGFVPGQDGEVPVVLVVLAGSPVEPGTRRHVRLDAEDGFHPSVASGLVEVQGPEHGPVVGGRQRRHPERRHLLEQLADARCPVEQGELRMGVEVNEAVPSHVPRWGRVLKLSDREYSLPPGRITSVGFVHTCGQPF